MSTLVTNLEGIPQILSPSSEIPCWFEEDVKGTILIALITSAVIPIFLKKSGAKNRTVIGVYLSSAIGGIRLCQPLSHYQLSTINGVQCYNKTSTYCNTALACIGIGIIFSHILDSYKEFRGKKISVKA